MTESLLDHDPARPAVPVTPIDAGGLEAALAALPAAQAAWARAAGFEAKPGSVVVLPGADGTPAGVLFGLGAAEAAERTPLAFGALANTLPPGTYMLADGAAEASQAAIAFGLGSYRFDFYRKPGKAPPSFMMSAGVDAAEIRRIVNGCNLARDLINTPANDMGPAELAGAVEAVGAAHGASVTAIVGDDLLTERLPMIHAVGRAATAARAPRLVDLVWGDPDAPKVTLVGKGVCFDTGGLDLKPSAGMLTMKKDMGGAANLLGLAAMIMDAGLKMRLRLLIPAVENAVSADAFRPGDVLASRKGVSVEIGNTDAEGRLVLADALALAGEEAPELTIDLATLTGAARVALGPELPAVYTGDDALASDLARHAAAVGDPVWRLPLWAPYKDMLKSKVADINNAGTGGFAGSITAALFLARFVADPARWLHGDIFAWTPAARPGRPEGGEAQTIRALYALLKERYG